MRKLLLHSTFVIRSIVPILSALASLPIVASDFDLKTGYRISDYRQVVNKDLDVGKKIESESQFYQLTSSDALLIDVAPLPDYLWIHDLRAWQLPTNHLSLPGTIWLPNVGRGVLSPELGHYLQGHLAKSANMQQPIIVFCFEDCWMSWNATQRIFRMGYTNVFWYPKGVTGRSPDQLQPVEPEPFLD
jgi:PQQ-dependent catabolism-associated CXXCW motif protein